MHQSVLLKEAVQYLAVKPGQKYIDATYGAGGHSREILARGGVVLGLDVSPQAISLAEKHPNLKAVRANFNKLEEAAKENGLPVVAGILFDLGVSSEELAHVPGISFQRDEPLDMRLDPNLGVTAADLLNALPEGQLAELFTAYGEEPFSRPLARLIVRARGEEKIETTRQLLKIVEKVKGQRTGQRTHPATQVFQALRIAVNGELESLKDALTQAEGLLSPGGRLVVISFHSGEDRIVKNFFKNSRLKSLTEKPVQPDGMEVSQNPRARSAKLRAAEKI